jgi:hypothetical protein
MQNNIKFGVSFIAMDMADHRVIMLNLASLANHQSRYMSYYMTYDIFSAWLTKISHRIRILHLRKTLDAVKGKVVNVLD